MRTATSAGGAKKDARGKLAPSDIALIRSELWRRGELRFLLLPHQYEIYDALKAALEDPECLKYFLNIARRFGKTTVLCIIALEIAIKQKSAQIRFATYTMKALRKIVIPIFNILLESCPADIRPEFNSKDDTYKFPKNKSEVHLAGCDNGNAENLRGTSSDLNVVDEAGFTDDLKYVLSSILIPQTLTTGATTFIATTPARSPAHESLEVMQECKLLGNYIELDVWKNTSLDERTINTYAKEAGGFDSTTWKREYLCQWVTDSETALVPEWNPRTMIMETEPPVLRGFFHNYVALDIGTRDKTAILFGYYDFTRAKLVIEDEWVPANPSEITTETLVAAVRVKEKELWGDRKPYRRVSDNNNLLLVQDLAGIHGLPFSPTTKDSLHAMVNEVRLWVGAGRLEVNPKCRQTIGCLEYGVWNKQRSEFDRSALYGHFDAFAALMYLIRNVDTYTNPIPVNHGLSVETHFIDNTETSRLAKVAGKLRPGLNTHAHNIKRTRTR